MKEKQERVELAQRTPEMVNPFQMMRRFSKDMERLFENFHGFNFPNTFGMDLTTFRPEFDMVWMPQIEVLQKNGEFMVRADLPGLKKEDVKLELTTDTLTISGERKQEKEESREGFYRSERMYGSFYREVPLPDGAKTENATATFSNGVLEVTMPAPKVETFTRKLEIKEPTDTKVARAATA